AQPPGALNGLIRPEAPPTGYCDLYALHKEAEGALFKLRGNARVQGANMAFQADEIDWNGETHDLEARGNVYYQNFDRNERIWCDSLKYNTEEQTGRFENPVGITQPRIIARPHVLTSTSPYYFQG